jgi:hypothetical protein
MKLVIQQYKTKKGVLKDKYSIQVVSPRSGHEPSLSPEFHPCHRKSTPSEVKLIESMTNSGVPPTLILENIHNTIPNSLLKSVDIHNIRYKLRTEKLHGMTTIQALFTVLKKVKAGIRVIPKTIMATSPGYSLYMESRSGLHGYILKSSSLMPHTKQIGSICHLSTPWVLFR